MARPYSEFKNCSVDNCNRNARARGLCSMHYIRLRDTGSTELQDRKKEPKACSVQGCNDYVRAKGLCACHYQKEQRKHWQKDRNQWKEANEASFELKRCHCGKIIERKRWGDGQLVSPAQYRRIQNCDGCKRKPRSDGKHIRPRSEDEIKRMIDFIDRQLEAEISKKYNS